MKKTVKILCGILLTLSLSAGMLSSINMQNTEAASGYKKLDTARMATVLVKNGRYYFKCSNDTVLISTKKDSGFQKTPLDIGHEAYGNGKEAYYVRDFILYKYTYASKKETAVKKLPTSGVSNDPAMSFSVSSVYNNQIYLTMVSQIKWKFWTYSYNIKTKRLKRLLSDCNIVARYGKYAVGQSEFRLDASGYPITLYKIQSSGLKKIKKLTSNGWLPTFAGGKLYYVFSTNRAMSKVTLYRCNLNGSGRKKVKTFSSTGQVLILNITSKSCDVHKDDNVYRYTYATKKMKKI